MSDDGDRSTTRGTEGWSGSSPGPFSCSTSDSLCRFRGGELPPSPNRFPASVVSGGESREVIPDPPLDLSGGPEREAYQHDIPRVPLSLEANRVLAIDRQATRVVPIDIVQRLSRIAQTTR